MDVNKLPAETQRIIKAVEQYFANWRTQLSVALESQSTPLGPLQPGEAWDNADLMVLVPPERQGVTVSVNNYAGRANGQPFRGHVVEVEVEHDAKRYNKRYNIGHKSIQEIDWHEVTNGV